MPYKFEINKMLISKKDDKRRRLTDQQKQEIKELYGKVSQRKLAKIYGVSRRTIIFIGDERQRLENLKRRAERGGSSQYYDKEKHKKYMKTHRYYKKELCDKGLLETNKV